MTRLFFADNTVLVNFGLINRMDLLRRLMNQNGAWCATVASECSRSAAEEGLEALNEAGTIFGDPLYPDSGAEHLDISMLRLELAAPGDGPRSHLGEAETLTIMHRRGIAGMFVTDDKSAARAAAQYDIPVITTWDLLRLGARVKLVDPDTLWGYLETLRASRRGAPPGVNTRRGFDEWLDLEH